MADTNTWNLSRKWGRSSDLGSGYYTRLLKFFRKRGFSFSFCKPISNINIGFMRYVFVDDTDLVQALLSSSTAEEVRNRLQNALDMWGGCLSVTCGAIAPEKTFWYSIDFVWHHGV
jgi:hypothetical protein